MEILRYEWRDDDAGRLEIADAGGNERDAFAGFDQGEDAGPGGGGVDDVGREAGGGAERDDAVEEHGRHLPIAE